MDNIIFAKYDMDSGFVQAWTEDCNLILIDCDAVEKPLRTICIRDLNWIISSRIADFAHSKKCSIFLFRQMLASARRHGVRTIERGLHERQVIFLRKGEKHSALWRDQQRRIRPGETAGRSSQS
ncbi:MAG: hypothetical protein IKE15_09405 [Clostridia bacterium]|nr:hypothetical protein [Clostridia bacterium]MBR2662279.1 hypothetical protein [Clostridia bacterium]